MPKVTYVPVQQQGICTPEIFTSLWYSEMDRSYKKTFPVPWVETVESNIGKKDTACKNGKVHMNFVPFQKIV